MMSEPIVGILTALVILIIIFLIIRELVMWYWKINERIELQKETNELLKKLIEKQKEII
jgi:hypothetical protein